MRELKASIWSGIKMFYVALLHGVVAWAVLAPVFIFLIYIVSPPSIPGILNPNSCLQTVHEFIRKDKRKTQHVA